MNETQRRRRGHAFMPPKAILRRVPKLYGTESTPVEDKTIWVHYFSPSGDYYVAELDPETNEAFGFVRYQQYPPGEWGYISLEELEQASYTARIMGRLVPMVGVERDMHWTPCKFFLIKR